MTTAEVAADGSFEIEASDGIMRVSRGMAVFECADKVFACLPKDVEQKLRDQVGYAEPAVADLIDKGEKSAGALNARRQRSNPLSSDYRLRLKPVIGEPPAPQFVAVKSLLVDDSYQRSIEGGPSRRQIVKMAENWDWRLCLPLLVSRRNGKLFVIDGQHRKEAADLRGDIHHLPVVIFDFGDPKAEAELFVQANRSRRPMSRLDDFHAAIVAGDLEAKAISDAIVAAGLSVGRQAAWQAWKPGEVIFVTAVGRLLKAHGERIIIAALSMIARAFDGSVLIGVGAVFEGLVAFSMDRATAGCPVEPELMVNVLSGVGIPGWREVVEGIEGGSDRAAAMLAAITSAYEEAEAE